MKTLELAVPYLIIELGGGDKLNINKPATTGFFLPARFAAWFGKSFPDCWPASPGKKTKKCPHAAGINPFLEEKWRRQTEFCQNNVALQQGDLYQSVTAAVDRIKRAKTVRQQKALPGA